MGSRRFDSARSKFAIESDGDFIRWSRHSYCFFLFCDGRVSDATPHGLVMTEITQEQRHFFLSHRIPMSMVFDASGLKRSEYKVAMEALGKHFAIGVTPCGNAGHTIRSRSGNCVQCNTANVAYQLRHCASGHVYLAGSPSAKILKIGMTSDLAKRVSILNHYRYGMADDWEMLLSVRTDDAGRIESSVHKALQDFSIDGAYFREGRKTRCYELFRCSYATARDALVDSRQNSAFAMHSAEERSRRIYW